MLVFSDTINAQRAQREWAPIGAKWYYGWRRSPVGPQEGYLLIESYKDTVLNGKKCKALRQTRYLETNEIAGKDRFPEGFESIYFDDIIVYNEEDRLYFFDYNAQNFHVLYDFSLNKGDTLVTRKPHLNVSSLEDSTLRFKVDSVGTWNGGEYPLRFYAVGRPVDEHDNEWNWGGIIEFIGGSNSFFPNTFNDCDGGLAPWPLRCYIDSTVHFQFTTYRDCDETITNIPELNEFESNIEVYPNPCSENINIRFKHCTSGDIHICDVTGKILKSKKIENNTKEVINVNTYKKGTYFLQINAGNKKYIKKIIKQ